MKNNNFVVINNEKTLDIMQMKESQENYIILDYDKCINDIYSSYKSSKKEVYNQFQKDFPRCSYIINNNIEKNINTFVNYFEFSIYKYNVKPYIIFMLCTQAIMGIALEKLYKNLSKKNLYIGELKKKTNLIFNFISNNNNLFLKITKILRLFTIKNNKDTTLKRISITIFISLYEKEKVIILYKILKN